jgi:hypothetical protein
MSIPKRLSVIAIALLITGLCLPAFGQWTDRELGFRTPDTFADGLQAVKPNESTAPRLQSSRECKSKNDPGCQAAASLDSAATPAGARDKWSQATMKKMEGWANVPGGTVWLEPGRQAYEHDTGLVRDLQTGQRSMPITPVLIQPQPLQPLVPMQPFAPAYTPSPYVMPYRNPHYDVGPYGRYDSGRGAISSGRGAIAGQWQQVKRLPR